MYPLDRIQSRPLNLLGYTDEGSNLVSSMESNLGCQARGSRLTRAEELPVRIGQATE
jgi:hypothetical protein